MSKRQVTVVKAHPLWTYGMNPWSRIPVITDRKEHYDWFIQEYATEADVKNKLYFYCPNAMHLRGQRFAMALVVEPLGQNYEIAKMIQDGPR